MDSFLEILRKVRPGENLPGRLLCLDPGETTGWAIFEDCALHDCGQTRTVRDGVIDFDAIRCLIMGSHCDWIVCEDYKVYAHKLDSHTFSPVVTLRVIGIAEYLAWEKGTEMTFQMAQQAKQFVTDDKLQRWGMYQEKMKHARDAIRHGVYFLLFHKRGKSIV